MPALLTPGVRVTIGGTALSAALLNDIVAVRVERTVGNASRSTVRFADPDFLLADDSLFQVGKELLVAFSDSTSSSTDVFKGEVVAMTFEQARGDRHELVVEAYDKAHRMGRQSKTKTWQDSNYADVVSSIAGANGMSSSIEGLGAVTHEYLMQNGTDIAMLDLITSRTGTEWSVDDGKLIVRRRNKPTVSAKLAFGDSLFRFKARFTSSPTVTGSTVTSWDPKTKKPVVSTVTTQRPATNGFDTWGVAGKIKDMGAGAVLNGSHIAATADEAKEIATALVDKHAAEEAIIRGETYGNPEMKVGTMVEVAGVGTRLAGKYYLTEVDHLFDPEEGYRTRFVAGGAENATLVDLLRSQSPAPGAWGNLGLVIGIVTRNVDTKDHRQGVVRVKFPTFSDQEESAWARVVGIGHGSSRGLHVMPEINDEVIVGFEHGDYRRPIVLGGVWNSTDKPFFDDAKTVKDGKVVKWGFKTRLGHMLEFNDADTAADQNITITTLDNNTKLVIGMTKIELIAKAGNPIEIKNDKASILLSDAGDVIIKGQKITLTSQMDIALSAGTGLEMKAGTTVKVTATATLELKGVGAKVDGGSMTEIKGGMVKIN